MKEKVALGYTLRFIVIAIFSIMIIFSIGYVFTSHLSSKKSDTPLPVFNKEDKIRIVIDPGHGGEDAGAIAPDGTLEKDLNLDIAKLLYIVFDLNGTSVELTRSEDTLLYDKYGDLTDYTGQKKVYDLKNRLKLAEENPNSIYVGIHMNKFSEAQYSGLQVYYSPTNPSSYPLAFDIKNTVHQHLQPQNNRPLKRADSTIYILHRAKIPSVLVECGFLSNEGELELLKSEDYQRALAINLFASLVKYAN